MTARMFTYLPLLSAPVCCGHPMTWHVWLAAYVCGRCGGRR